jgi:hypothetical protein
MAWEQCSHVLCTSAARATVRATAVVQRSRCGDGGGGAESEPGVALNFSGTARWTRWEDWSTVSSNFARLRNLHRPYRGLKSGPSAGCFIAELHISCVTAER